MDDVMVTIPFTQVRPRGKKYPDINIMNSTFICSSGTPCLELFMQVLVFLRSYTGQLLQWQWLDFILASLCLQHTYGLLHKPNCREIIFILGILPNPYRPQWSFLLRFTFYKMLPVMPTKHPPGLTDKIVRPSLDMRYCHVMGSRTSPRILFFQNMIFISLYFFLITFHFKFILHLYFWSTKLFYQFIKCFLYII